jgi:DDE superfamily endonuclease
MIKLLPAGCPQQSPPPEVQGAGHPISFPARLAEIAATNAGGRPIEIWFADEARIGQKNKIARRWAKRGTRPSAPSDQRTGSAYIFGAICPARGTGAALVLPFCNSATMSMQLAEISQRFCQGSRHLVGGAGLSRLQSSPPPGR